MFTVLIVEDEMLVRIGLKNSIDWEEMDMKVIADVSNGQAALEVYQKEKPHLILTDIKMPVMDGLQLITKIRESDIRTKIIILTCYEEFDLIHKALKLGVSDYILKLKMNPDEIKSVLKKVQAEIKKENISNPANHDLKVDDSLVKENIIKEYIFYQRYTDVKFTELADKLKLRINPERMVMCILTIDQYELLQDKYEDQQGNLVRFAVLNILEELLSGFNRGEAIHEKDGRYILVFSFYDMLSENKIYGLLQDILDRISSVMKTYINTSVTFGISSIHNSYPSLKDMYQQCITALEQSYFFGAHKFIRWDDTGIGNISLLTNTKLMKFLSEADISDEAFAREIESGINTLTHNSCMSGMEIQKMFIRWIHWPAVNINISRDILSKHALDYGERIRRCSTLDDTIRIFSQYLEEIARCRTNSRYMCKEVAEAIQFIQTNYHRDITLQEVAAQVEISPNYLSSLFRKDSQVSFTEYLNQVRIDRAKDMFLNTHLKIYEVAQKVGFSDESYFSRIFKRLTGMSPYEFKKQWLVDIQEGKNARKD